MGKTFKDNPGKWRKHSDNKPKKQKGKQRQSWELSGQQHDPRQYPNFEGGM